MKKRILNTLICFITLFLTQDFYGQSEKLNINTSKSKLNWSGEYAFYFGGHDGTIDFEEGYFVKTGDIITGGEFIIDISTITSTDLEEQKARKSLDDHLKNEDFFDVLKFPKSKLTITSVEYHNAKQMKIYANLTIKDITRTIDFQAEADYDKKQLTAKFKIDRTLWGINYNSKEVEGKLKDGLISDAIGFEVLISL